MTYLNIVAAIGHRVDEVFQIIDASTRATVAHPMTLAIRENESTADVELLMRQLQRLLAAGNTVILVEHEMSVVAAADWVIDLGPGAGAAGGQIVASGTPVQVARVPESRTATYLAQRLARG